MAYTPPTLSTFTAAFPSFPAVEQATYDLWLAQAVLITEPLESCLATRIDMATMMLTAHYLTLAGIGTGAESEMAAQGMAGFKSIRSGSLSLERAESAKGTAAGEYAATSYGLRAWAMISPCVAGPRVAGTGYPACGVGFNGYAGVLPPWAC
jgi:hypothetical protein